jgi:hypothetical protein
MGQTSLAMPGLIFEVAKKQTMTDQKARSDLRSDVFLAAYGQDVM